MASTLVTLVGALPRFWKRVIIVGFDILALAFALWVSFSLRYGSWAPPNTLEQFVVIGTAPLVAIPIFVRLGLYRAVIRYLPERRTVDHSAGNYLGGGLLGSAGISVGDVGLHHRTAVGADPFLGHCHHAYRRQSVPRQAPALVGGVDTYQEPTDPGLWCGRSRGAARQCAAAPGQASGSSVSSTTIPPCMAAMSPGIRVFASSHFKKLVEQYSVDEVILSVPTLSAARKKEIIALVSGHGVKITTLPPMSELVSGKYLVSQIREIEIDELLGRPSVPADPELAREMIEGRSIMVTRGWWFDRL